jgi:hypothetical protein
MTYNPKNRMNAGFLLSVLGLSSICAPAQTVKSAILGAVSGPDGKPLSGASVWANLVSLPPRPVDGNSAVPVLRAVSAKDGTFTISGVPAGQYRICSNHSSAGALNPCIWGGAPLVQVSSVQLNAAAPAFRMETGVPHEVGKAAQPVFVAAPAFRMETGVPLQVHLDDPGGYVAAHVGKDPKATLIVGLATQRGFLPFPVTATTATGRDYLMLVPLNVTHNVVISTQYFKMTNASGSPIGAQPISVTFSSSVPTQANVIIVRITGAGN